MTTDETPAEVIEAAHVMHRHRCCAAEYYTEHHLSTWINTARALHAAGLLVDPADRDEPDWQAIADQAEQDMAHWVRECGDAERRAERAEAEVARLQQWKDEASPVHVTPVNDQIEHVLDEDCPCGPASEAVKRADGSVGWVIIHHSLDGRES